MHTKICRKCGIELLATTDNFYRNAGSKYGLTPRCKPCVNEDNAASHAKRLAADPERIRALATERSKRSYHKNLDSYRAKHREYQAKRRADPQKHEVIKARKRASGAGLSPEAIAAILETQGNCCAICKTTTPGSKIGWNLDHCHRTNRVRFVLCAHCNRGLGAFRDDPNIMRKAADMLEQFNQNQADKPVAAIYEKG